MAPEDFWGREVSSDTLLAVLLGFHLHEAVEERVALTDVPGDPYETVFLPLQRAVRECVGTTATLCVSATAQPEAVLLAVPGLPAGAPHVHLPEDLHTVAVERTMPILLRHLDARFTVAGWFSPAVFAHSIRHFQCISKRMELIGWAFLYAIPHLGGKHGGEGVSVGGKK